MKIAELHDLLGSGNMIFCHYSDIGKDLSDFDVGKDYSDKFSVKPYFCGPDEPLRHEYENFDIMQIEHSTVGIIVYFDYPDY